MAVAYSVDTCRKLAEAFAEQALLRPLRIGRYEPGTELTYDMTGVFPARQARVTLAVERFVGGGFAGQVYRVTVKAVGPAGAPAPDAADDGAIEGLHVGGRYAMKVLVPPGRFSLAFRNAIYFLGFQSPFQHQVNPAAARAGALWQKLIRRAAGLRFGTERAVKDVQATFVDSALGACGEISEWVEGRTWRFEVDDDLFARWRWKVGRAGQSVGSPEYRAKKQFMADFVRLLHDMGAPELARQYEWWTCKSQPNCFKRSDSEADPAAGLTAMDFRAGLALLPFLPMSPADVWLIVRGLARGRLVQFDRGDLDKLSGFIEAHRAGFADMLPALEDLKAADAQYRDSQVDLTHHHVRLLYDGALWSRLREAAITGWHVEGAIDEQAEKRLRSGRLRAALFWAMGLVPLLGAGLRKLFGRADLREHYGRLLAGGQYAGRAIRAHVAERLIGWHREGRVGPDMARRLAGDPLLFLILLPLSLLPATLHRILTDRAFAVEKLRYILIRPVRLYFNAEAREQWLRDMVAEGQANHMVTDEDAHRILSRIGEPFIQKYLKSLAVHVCTLPVTQIVSGALAMWYYLAHPELSAAVRGYRAGLILAAFQVTPISPGSLVRGLYVLWLVIRERDFRNYNIAAFLGFFKYVGYLAFPIQMAYHYPALARFMAGHWATGAVHVVPVFGEKGALLEHCVFDLFYNYPLTIRRRMARRAEALRDLPVRLWHAVPCAALAVALLAAVDATVLGLYGVVPSLKDVWYAAIWAPVLAGAGVVAWAGGMSLGRRIVLAVVTGLAVAGAYATANFGLSRLTAWPRTPGDAAVLASWSAFLFAMLAGVAALLVEMHAPAPRGASAVAH